MRRFFLLILMVAFCSGGLFSQMKLDVKTKFKEKYQLKGIKCGVIYFLKKDIMANRSPVIDITGKQK